MKDNLLITLAVALVAGILLAAGQSLSVDALGTTIVGRLVSVVAILLAARRHFALGVSLMMLWLLFCHPKVRKSLDGLLQQPDPFLDVVARHRAQS